MAQVTQECHGMWKATYLASPMQLSCENKSTYNTLNSPELLFCSSVRKSTYIFPRS